MNNEPISGAEAEGWPVAKQYASPQEAAADGWPVQVAAGAPLVHIELPADTKSEVVAEVFASVLTAPVATVVSAGWPTPAPAPVELDDNVPLPTAEVVAPDDEDPVAKAFRIKAEVASWTEAKETFANAKDDERNWRDKVTKSCFPKPKKGTQRFDLGSGVKVKLQQTFSYNLIADEANLGEDELPKPLNDQIEEIEDKIRLLGPIAAERLKNLIKWKPELSGSVYEKLDAKDDVDLAIRNILDTVLEIKPGAPQLSIEEPKEK